MKFVSLALALALTAASSGAQTTWFVDASASAPGNGSPSQPFQQIQAGFDASAVQGDTVRVLTGSYVENLVLDGKSVELVAASGVGSVAVDGSDIGPAFAIENHPVGSTTVVRGFTFENGRGRQLAATASRGGGLYVEGTANTAFDSCVFTGNHAEEGGGAYVGLGSHAFVACEFDGNRGDRGAGLYSAGAALVLQASSVTDNRHFDEMATSLVGRRGIGLAIELSSDPAAAPVPSLVEDCDVSRNDSTFGPGGIGIYARSLGPVTIRHTTVTENGRTGENGLGALGSGIFAASDTVVSHCEIRRNGARSSFGGGLYSVSDALRASDCIIADNQAAEGGGAYGGIYGDCLFEGNTGGGLCCAEPAQGGGAARATLVRCVLRANRVFQGGFLGGGGASHSDLRECLVEFNYTEESFVGDRSGEGGGLYACTAVDCIVRGNSADFGGGVLNCGNQGAPLLRCTIENNVAFDRGGGAVESTLVDCQVKGNRAGDLGGGVVDSVLTRCVISGNSATLCGGVGGSTLNFCTVTGNRASSEVGGVGSNGNPMFPFAGFFATINNSIVYANEPDNAGSTLGPLSDDGAVAVEWSIVQGGWTGTGNLDADGLVTGPFSGNAQLLAGSPAIDSGDPAAPLDPDGSRADMGAIPFDSTYVPEPTEYCIGKANALGCVPQIGWAGSATLSGPDDFVLTGSGLNGASFALIAAAPNPAATQAFGGTICVGAGLVRLGVLPTGGALNTCDGAVSLNLPQAQLAGYGPGTLLYAQMLVRDPANPDGSGAALSAGLEFRILP